MRGECSGGAARTGACLMAAARGSCSQQSTMLPMSLLHPAMPMQVDSCCGTQDHAAAIKQYELYRDALNATGVPVYYSLCGCVRAAAQGPHNN